MNKVILIGNLTKDIELKQGNTTVGKFGLAVQRPMKRDEVDFINCVAFGKTAETMEQYLSKGSKVALEGRIQTGSYTNKEGNKVFTTDVIVDRFEFVGGNKADNNNSKQRNNMIDDMMPVDDGDCIPF